MQESMRVTDSSHISSVDGLYTDDERAAFFDAGMDEEGLNSLIEHLASKQFFYPADSNPRRNPELLDYNVDVINKMQRTSLVKVGSADNERLLTTEDDYKEYAFALFKEATPEQRLERVKTYLAAHSPKYLELLRDLSDSLSRPIGEHDVLTVITAQNEIEIDRAIDAAEAKTDLRQHFIVFDNFHREDKSDEHAGYLDDYLDVLAKRPNVSVVRCLVPDYSNVGFAKKIAADLALFTQLQSEQLKPLFFLDADVVDFEQEGYLEEMLEALDDPYTLAASMEFDYDEGAEKAFPGFGFRAKLKRKVRENIKHRLGFKKDRLIGASFVIQPDTLALVDGIKPNRGMDIDLTKKLRDGVRYMWHAFNPVQQLQSAVLVNPSKEIRRAEAGEHPESEWLESTPGQRTRSGLRFDWRRFASITNELSSPLLNAELTDEAVVDIVQGVLQDELTILKNSNLNEIYDEALSCAVIDACVSLGVTQVQIVLSNGAVLKSPVEMQAFLKRYNMTDTDRLKTVEELREELKDAKLRKPWKIERIEAVTDQKGGFGEDLKYSQDEKQRLLTVDTLRNEGMTQGNTWKRLWQRVLKRFRK